MTVQRAKTVPSFESRWERRLSAGLKRTFHLEVDSARGTVITAADGRRFLDFTTGIGVNDTGHLHPEVAGAIRAQLERSAHLMLSVGQSEPLVTLAEKCAAYMPHVIEKIAFFNSGAEAVENSIKISRKFTKRPNVIAFDNAFHGRTLLTMTLTGRMRPYKTGFGPFAPGVFRAPFPDSYRPPKGVTPEDWAEECLAAFRRTLRVDADPRETAAVLVEPIQGEGGFIVAPDGFLEGLRETCDEHDLILISDEIQAGLGRTGKWLAIDHDGVEPDLVTLGKAIGGGLPLSAVAGRADVMDAPEPGTIGGTFGGNPLSCAAGAAALDVIEENLERATELGEHAIKRLRKLQSEHAAIGDVRGRGLMFAAELVQDPDTKEPAPELAKKAQAECFARGLLVLTCGTFDNVVRFLPPLTVDRKELEEGLKIFGQAVTAATKTGTKK